MFNAVYKVGRTDDVSETPTRDDVRRRDNSVQLDAAQETGPDGNRDMILLYRARGRVSCFCESRLIDTIVDVVLRIRSRPRRALALASDAFLNVVSE